MNEHKGEIESIKTNFDMSFVQSMFAFDNEPLYAFGAVSTSKFVDSVGWKLDTECA